MIHCKVLPQADTLLLSGQDLQGTETAVKDRDVPPLQKAGGTKSTVGLQQMPGLAVLFKKVPD